MNDNDVADVIVAFIAFITFVVGFSIGMVIITIAGAAGLI